MDYKTDVVPSAEAVAALYLSAGLNRPISDLPRIAAMYANSNLIVTAWDGDLLVGVSRALSDFSFCCYLSDLAVHEGYKRSGIGKKLIEITREKAGPQCCLLLLSAPGAMEYYPKMGFETVQNGFMIPRIH